MQPEENKQPLYELGNQETLQLLHYAMGLGVVTALAYMNITPEHPRYAQALNEIEDSTWNNQQWRQDFGQHLNATIQDILRRKREKLN